MDVKFKVTALAHLHRLPVVDGQLIVIKDTADMYYDMSGVRRRVGLGDVNPMVFKGSLGTGGTLSDLPDPTKSQGHTYVVITEGTYRGIQLDVGDTVISDGAAWIRIPSGDEPSGTVTSISLKGDTIIKVNDETPVTTSGVRQLSHSASGAVPGTYGESEDKKPGFGDSIKVPAVTVDAAGHITSVSEREITLPKDPGSVSVNDGKLVVNVNGQPFFEFSANQSGDGSYDLAVPTKVSDLDNDLSYVTSQEVEDVDIDFSNIFNE